MLKVMNRRKLRQKNHAVQILEAGEKLFAKKGFYPTTMEEVARAAGLAKGTIYLHFNDKRDLFFSIIEKKLDILLEKIEKEMRKDEFPSQRIKLAIGIHLRFLEENRDFFKIMQALPESLKQEMERKLKGRVIEKQSRYVEILDQLIRKGIRNQEIKPLDSRKLAVILVGMMHSLTIYWISRKEKGSLSQDDSLVWQVFWEGISKEA
ncbi:TetR/AcrR family transcriptional regulator [Candidatus Aerophobetes bacterium]|uniref:TetR/AcrR family transcriptional regulator n=1 Tax=Aerophobetes bacterium TaxID=2030807 RepID=A0A523Y333_UNCAE|nr:MAG: TetR/AcrR family transcriptional regulator [Candidatus Aerophobetes bacterium]